MNVSREFQECFKRYFKDLKAFKLFFKVALFLTVCFKCVSKNFKMGLKMFTGNFKVFKRSFLLHGSHYSYPNRRRACFFGLG